MILLYHDDSHSGQVVLSEGRVAGEHTRARIYQHDGHFLAVDGADHLIAHDVAEILRIPGYRVATASEQQAYAAQQKKASSLTEKKGK